MPVDSASAFDFLDALQSGGDPLSALEAAPALYGFGFGIDLGAILEFGGWKVGLAVRDFLGTRIAYTQSSFGPVLEALRERGGLPTGGTAVAEDHRIPMDLSVGLAYHFDSAPRVVDPVVHLALSDLIGVLGRRAFALEPAAPGDRSPPAARPGPARRAQPGLPDFRRGPAGAAAGDQRRFLHPRAGAAARRPAQLRPGPGSRAAPGQACARAKARELTLRESGCYIARASAGR